MLYLGIPVKLDSEKLEIDFHNRMRASYLDIAKGFPERCRIGNANQDIQAVHNQVIRFIRDSALTLVIIHVLRFNFCSKSLVFLVEAVKFFLIEFRPHIITRYLVASIVMSPRSSILSAANDKYT